jgi:LysM domain-containing protein
MRRDPRDPGWSDRLRRALGGRPRAPGASRGEVAPLRHPVYGGQAHRDSHYAPYVVGFLVIIAALAAFLYVGLNWATGPGRLAAIANPPTAVPTPAPPIAAPSPSPTVGEQTYIVRPGDNPASIAQQFRIKTEDLMAANNIDDPSKLQIGQTLKIPPPTSSR